MDPIGLALHDWMVAHLKALLNDGSPTETLESVLQHFGWRTHVMAVLMVFLKNALICIKKVKLINHDCLPILMLLYIMLYIVLAYLVLYIALACLMLFAALSSAVCLCNASFLQMISANAFYFHVLSWFIHT